MKVRFLTPDPAADQLLPPNRRDGSGVGVNYVDACLKPLKLTLSDGRKVACKRRGLKLTLSIGDKSGDGLLRRLAHGPDEKTIFHEALAEAARNAGAEFIVEDGVFYLDVSEPPT